VVSAGQTLRLQFDAKPGRSYAVQFRDVFEVGPWTTLEAVPEQPSARTVTVSDSGIVTADGRLYRVITPGVP
jgi:hypothetical protein